MQGLEKYVTVIKTLELIQGYLQGEILIILTTRTLFCPPAFSILGKKVIFPVTATINTFVVRNVMSPVAAEAWGQWGAIAPTSFDL